MPQRLRVRHRQDCSGYYVSNFYNYGTYFREQLEWPGRLHQPGRTGGATFQIYNSGGGQLYCIAEAAVTTK